MSGITRDQRSMGWNITFYLGDTALAGIFQAKNCVTIGDVARDLDLCLVFQQPLDDWKAALLPRHDLPSEHILLDASNTTPFPDPDIATQYTYLFHSRNRCDIGSGAHTRRSACYQQPPLPSRRHHQRYAAIGKQPEQAGKSCMMPLRQTRGTKRSASGSRSRPPSASASTPSEADNEEIPVSVVSPDTARAKISAFRSNVLSSGNTVCAISGKGKSWIGGLVGTGIEAAHIIPQNHWAVYPLDDLNVISIEEKAQLEIAWRRTWM